MTRPILVLLFCGIANACAVIDMPVNDGRNPAWVEDRLAADAQTREAPLAVSERRIETAEERALRDGQSEVLESRATMDADLAAMSGSDESSAEDFITDGQERVTPPEE